MKLVDDIAILSPDLQYFYSIEGKDLMPDQHVE